MYNKSRVILALLLLYKENYHAYRKTLYMGIKEQVRAFVNWDFNVSNRQCLRISQFDWDIPFLHKAETGKIKKWNNYD
jgi:hypothetical protein